MTKEQCETIQARWLAKGWITTPYIVEARQDITALLDEVDRLNDAIKGSAAILAVSEGRVKEAQTQRDYWKRTYDEAKTKCETYEQAMRGSCVYCTNRVLSSGVWRKACEEYIKNLWPNRTLCKQWEFDEARFATKEANADE